MVSPAKRLMMFSPSSVHMLMRGDEVAPVPHAQSSLPEWARYSSRLTVCSAQKYCTHPSSAMHQYSVGVLHPRRSIGGLAPAVVIWRAYHRGLILLLHHEPLPLLIAQIELCDSRGFGCPFVRCLNVTKVLGAGLEN